MYLRFKMVDINECKHEHRNFELQTSVFLSVELSNFTSMERSKSILLGFLTITFKFSRIDFKNPGNLRRDI
jgi:hypothetical protein